MLYPLTLSPTLSRIPIVILNIFYSHRYYNNPNPSTNDVREFADTLRAKVEQALKHNRRKETLTFDCRADVFKSLFKGKGYFLNRWQVLQKDDFPQQYFPEGWAVRCNKHGEGMQLHFPVKVRWYISWSPLKYTNDNDTGNIIPCKRAPLEKISVDVIKVAA